MSALRHAAALLVVGSGTAAAIGTAPSVSAALPAPHPTVSDYQFIAGGTTPPTEAQCEAVARTCFTPQAIQSAYNVGPLYAQGLDGRGITIAIVDSYGSDTMAHDLHVFDQAFGVRPMCGEEGVTCVPGMPKFSELAMNGSPPTVAQPGNGTHLEDKSAWALEVALDVETSHAIATGTKQPTAKGGALIPFPSVEWPASDPLVTGIGGTYLCTDPTASTSQARTPYVKSGIGGKCGSSVYNPGGVFAEVAWTFSGGGFSHVFAKPTWQNTLPTGSTPIATMRGVPDVAFQASAGTGALVYVSLPPDGNGSNVGASLSGWYDIGGTSLSCPQWAGLVAIADQLNGGGLGLINPALYKIGADSARYKNDFFDVASGNTNQTDSSVAGYAATKGWDAVT